MEHRIDGHTRLFCLIGSPVGHSGSPAMYNYSFDKLGLNNAYLAFDIPLEKVGEAVKALRLMNVGGFNITMPGKTAVCDYLDELSPAVKLIGACNTVTVGEDGKLTGHNTDGVGFVRNLEKHGVSVKGKSIVVLGAGGAATALSIQCALDGSKKIVILNRKSSKSFANAEQTVEKIVSNIPGCEAEAHADIAISPAPGPEVITGSSRLKAGTAQKLILNMLSTGAMIRTGKVVGNLMINVRPTNIKLRDRCIRILMELGGCDRDTAAALIDDCGDIRTALGRLGK